MSRENPNDNILEGMTEDEKIVQEAKDEFKLDMEYESDFHRNYILDTKFCLGDSVNGWQWPDDLRKDREKNRRPPLTINKAPSCVSHSSNNARQNGPSINIKP